MATKVGHETPGLTVSSMEKNNSGMWDRITRSVFVQQGTGIKHDVQQPVSDAYKSTHPKISQLVPRELNKLLYWKDSMNQSAGEASDCCKCCSFIIKSAKKKKKPIKSPTKQYLLASLTYDSVLSSLLPVEPMISPNVQNIWPRKSLHRRAEHTQWFFNINRSGNLLAFAAKDNYWWHIAIVGSMENSSW